MNDPAIRAPGSVALSILLGLGCLLFNHSAFSADRIALVIGNSAYEGASKLPNPVNDARAVAKALSNLKFDVTEALDLGDEALRAAIRKYYSQLTSGDKVGFFYFAGHAIQINGNNYLIPVDVSFEDANEVLAKGYDIRELLNALSNNRNNMNVIVLDSCRNNPFASMDTGDLSRGIELYAQPSLETSTLERKTLQGDTSVSTDPGLGRMDAPINTLIAYSTKPGFVALDGNDRNSPYTRALVKMMQQEGVHISQVFADVRKEVYQRTKGKQMPWESSSLTDSFVFKERKKAYATPF